MQPQVSKNSVCTHVGSVFTYEFSQNGHDCMQVARDDLLEGYSKYGWGNDAMMKFPIRLSPLSSPLCDFFCPLLSLVLTMKWPFGLFEVHNLASTNRSAPPQLTCYFLVVCGVPRRASTVGAL